MAACERSAPLPIITAMQDRDLLDLFDLSYAAEEGIGAYLNRMLERSVAWFGASGASIFLRNDEDSALKLVASSGAEPRHTRGAVIVPGVGIAGTSIETRQPLLINDPAQHPLLSGRVNHQRKLSYTALVVPLVMPTGDVVGVLNVSRRLEEKAFDERDLRLAKTLGNNIALAISNAALVDRLSESLARSVSLQEKLQGIIDHAGVAIVVLDKQGEITDFNSSVAEICDADPDGITFRSFLESLPRGLRETFQRARGEAGTRQDFQERAYDKALDRSWSVVGSPMPGGGLTIVVDEVTEQERALHELARIKRLAEIGQMTAAIAHEIRNPLASICSAAQLVQSETGSVTELGAIIESEARKLNGLCDEFLNFARPVELDLRPIRLNSLITSIASSHAAEFQEAGVDLIIVPDPGDPIVMADLIRMEQACRNLLINALHACAKGGCVSARVEGLGFSIEDSGQGMDGETVQRLFTPFFTTKPKGTGLGLSNVKKIVDAHHGRIDFSTTPRRGTRFTISLEQRSA